MENCTNFAIWEGEGSRKRKRTLTNGNTETGEVKGGNDGLTSTKHNIKPLNIKPKLVRPSSSSTDTSSVNPVTGSSGLPLLPIHAHLPNRNPFVGNFAYSPSTSTGSFSVMFGSNNTIITGKEMFRLHRIKAHPLTGTFHSRPRHYSKLHGLYKFTNSSVKHQRRRLPPRLLSQIRAGFAKQPNFGLDASSCFYVENALLEVVDESTAYSAEQRSANLKKGDADGLSSSVGNSKTESTNELPDIDEEPLIGAVTPLLRHMHRKKPSGSLVRHTASVNKTSDPQQFQHQSLSLVHDPELREGDVNSSYFSSGHNVKIHDNTLMQEGTSADKEVEVMTSYPCSIPTSMNCSVGTLDVVDAGSTTDCSLVANYKSIDADECVGWNVGDMPGKFTLRTVLDDSSSSCWEDIIDRYHFSNSSMQLLGEGAYSNVFAAVSKKIGQQVAVKRINKRHLFSDAEVACIKREVQHMRILSTPPHPNIVTLLDVFETQQYIYMVLERVGWGALEDLLFLRRTLPESEARIIFYQLMKAVFHLHQKGIVHCDVKPPNILFACPPSTNIEQPRVVSSPDLDADSMASKTPFPDPLPFVCPPPNMETAVVKLCDFGHSRSASAFGIPWNLYQYTGTERYIAPEILAQQTYGTGVDIWSSGVTLFKIISGWEPFISCSSCLDRKPELVGTCWDGVSNELKGLVCGMLQVDAHLRLTASEVLHHAWFKDLAKTVE
eukprot:272940_1